MVDPYKPPAAYSARETLHDAPPLLWNPLLWLALITALMTLEDAWFAQAGEQPPANASRLWAFLFGVLLAWWVHADRRSLRIGMPYEFDAFVVFMWPIVVPYYLYRTRGAWGLVLGAGSWLLYCVPMAVSFALDITLSE